MTEAKSKYFSNLISENSENPRHLWDTIQKRVPVSVLPEFDSINLLCYKFSTYFISKIETIRSKYLDHIQIYIQSSNLNLMTLNLCLDCRASERREVRRYRSDLISAAAKWSNGLF